jgi:hypothetical protein
LERLAFYAAGVTGLTTYYPAPPTVVTPCLVLFWDVTTLSEMSEQTWLMTVKGQMLMSLKGNTQGEIRAADSLIAPLADAFSANVSPRDAYHLRDGADGVDFCQLQRIVPSLWVGYAGHDYYGAEVYFSIKLRRFAQE